MKIAMALSAVVLAGTVTACGATATATAPAGSATAAAAGSGTSHPPQGGVSAPASHAEPASAAEIAAQLKAADMPVTALISYTAVTDPNHLLGRQGGYTSKVAWQDPRAIAAGAGQPTELDPGGIEYGGGIEAFGSMAAAGQRLAELKSLTPPIGDRYDYLSGTAILRLSNYLTPAQALAYLKAFTAAVSGLP
jgi:hypothetical protein